MSSTNPIESVGPSAGQGEGSPPNNNHTTENPNNSGENDNVRAGDPPVQKTTPRLQRFFKAVRDKTTTKKSPGMDESSRKRKADEIVESNSNSGQHPLAPPPEAFHFAKRPRSISNDSPSGKAKATISLKVAAASAAAATASQEVIDLCDSEDEEPGVKTRNTFRDSIRKSLQKSAMAFSLQNQNNGDAKSAPLDRNSLAGVFAAEASSPPGTARPQKDAVSESNEDTAEDTHGEVVGAPESKETVEEEVPEKGEDVAMAPAALEEPDSRPATASVAEHSPKVTGFQYIPVPKSPGKFILSTCSQKFGQALHSAQKFCRQNSPSIVTIQVGKPTANPKVTVQVGKQPDQGNNTVKASHEAAAAAADTAVGVDNEQVPVSEMKMASIEDKDSASKEKVLDMKDPTVFAWSGGMRLAEKVGPSKEDAPAQDDVNVAATASCPETAEEAASPPVFATENRNTDTENETLEEKMSPPTPVAEGEETNEVPTSQEQQTSPSDIVEENAEIQQDTEEAEDTVETEVPDVETMEETIEVEPTMATEPGNESGKEEKATQSDHAGVDDSDVADSGNGDHRGQLSMFTSAEDDSQTSYVPVTMVQLLRLTMAVLCVAAVLRMGGFFATSNALLVGCSRAAIQLLLLGSVSAYALRICKNYPVVLCAIVGVVVALTASEIISRAKYTYEGQFLDVFRSLFLIMCLCYAGALFCVERSQDSVLDPRFVLPIAGLLLGSSMGGLSACIDTVSTLLVDGQDEVYLLQSFGASREEATQHIVPMALAKGLASVLGMMRGVGMLGIMPGMMCGLIIGGVSAQQAALYQVWIAVSIALYTISANVLLSYSTLWAAFEPLEVFSPHLFVRNQKRGLLSVVLWLWGAQSGEMDQIVPGTQGNIGLAVGNDLIAHKDVSDSPFVNFNALERSSKVVPTVFGVSGFALNNILAPPMDEMMPVSWNIRLGEIWELDGTNPSIKRDCLRAFGGLHSDFQGNLTLDGVSWTNANTKGFDFTEWRKHVLFLPRDRPRLGGTPLQFLKRIAAFQSWSKSSEIRDEDRARKLIHYQSDYLQHWGMSLGILNRDWDSLSDEDAYMVLVATALASRPKVLLLDQEWLPPASKYAVDQSIRDYAAQERGGVLMISE